MPGKLLLVVGKVQSENQGSPNVNAQLADTQITPGDLKIKNRLTDKFGFNVNVEFTSTVKPDHAKVMEIILLSPTCANHPSLEFNQCLESFSVLPVPLIVLETSLLERLKMGSEQHDIDNPEIAIISKHFLSADLFGKIRISEGHTKSYAEVSSTEATKIASLNEDSELVVGDEQAEENQKSKKNFAVVTSQDATRIASMIDDEEKLFFFAYASGSRMNGGALAPARRIAMALTDKLVQEAKPEMWKLFDAAVEWAGEAQSFNEVMRSEWAEIATRRAQVNYPKVTNGATSPENLVGLALSGGGIRSATFSLGLLQGLQENNLLRIFDYLSTVSGGGYLGGWWSAILSRQNSFYSTLTVRDIKDGKKLASLLHTGQKEITKYLFNKFKRQDLERLGRPYISSRKRGQFLAELFAELLNDPELYGQFKDELNEEKVKERAVKLYEMLAKQLNPDDACPPESAPGPITNRPTGDILRGLNWLILESAYEGEIPRLSITQIPARLYPADFYNPERLVGRMLEPLSEPLLKFFDEKSLDLITDADVKPDDQTGALVKELNRHIRESSVPGLNRTILDHTYSNEIQKSIFTDPEEIEPQRIPEYIKRDNKIFEGSLCAGTDPIHHLRLFSNYLTPRKGLLSLDTWQAVTMVIRNLSLTWIVLLPILFAVTLAGQFYFALQKNSENEYFREFQAEIRNEEKNLAAVSVKSKAAREKEEQTRDSAIRGIRRLQLTPDDFDKRRSEIIKASEDQLLSIGASENLEKETLENKVKELNSQYTEVLYSRANSAFYPLAILFIWMLVTTIFFMRMNVTREAISKVMHSFPGIFFWIILICMFYIISPLSGDHFQSGGAEFIEALMSLSFRNWFWMGIVSLIFSLALWWRSLPREGKAEEKHPIIERVKKRAFGKYRTGNLVGWLLTFFTTSLCVFILVVVKLMVDKGTNARFFWFTLIAIVGAGLVWERCSSSKEEQWEWRKILHGNKIMRYQSIMLVVFVVTALILLLSGFGYEMGNYLIGDSSVQKTVVDYIAKAGGWVTLIASIAGSIYTAVKASPTGGEDKSRLERPSGKTQLIFALTPLLVLVSLAVAFAWVGRWILIKESHSQGYSLDKYVEVTNIAIFSSVAMYLFFAIYEIRQWKDKFWPFIGSLLLVALTGVLSFFSLRWLDIQLLKLHPENPRTWCYFVMFTILFIVGAMIHRFLIGFYKKIFLSLALPLVSVPLLLYLRSFIPLPDKLFSGIKAAASTLGQHDEYFLASIIACAVAVGLIRWLWDEKTNRSIFLVAFTYLILVSFLLFTCFAHSQYKNRALLAYLTLGLVFVAISWSVACGWMSDPNYLSMHTFYKSRLVRAYLGASNPNREEKEITDSAAEDDILLSNLKNCERGAAYHLVNTTLNLVGGRDLASAQRSSANFVFSKLYSGSSRTGYRRNLPEQYMQGQMTLGTAVAISGAAVSPNMGAKTQTSAVAMLLTLLNVRLGFWAPTPNHKSWRSSQAGLWPFYMLREFLSQTNDLSNYCYLTDGGHFDNTGLYSLIERGCRFIVVVDNGADPNNFFEDLGDAIRRCRIDFKTKINLDITQLFKKKDELSGDALAQKHFIVGTLKYTEDHLSSLGWNEAQIKNNRKGVIILIKPSLVLGDSLDLRQYKWQNWDFPQQSTADQWYDEAQFESYRKLGKWCAQSMVQHLELDTRLGNATQLSPEDISKAIEKAEKKFNRENTGTKPSVLDPPI